MNKRIISYTSTLNTAEIYEQLDKHVFQLVGIGDVPNQDYSFKRNYCGTFDYEKFSIQRGKAFQKMRNCTLRGTFKQNTENGALIDVEIKPSTDLLIMRIAAAFILPVILISLLREVADKSLLPVVFMTLWLLGGLLNYSISKSRTEREMKELEQTLYSIMPKSGTTL